jgi:hypothetical protein
MSERPNPIGGTIAESLFGQGIGAPAVAIDAAQIKQYRDSPAVTDIMEFPDRGHSLTIDSGWHEIADAALTWISKQCL